MSLLLDARKKSQSAQSGEGARLEPELSLEKLPDTTSLKPDALPREVARNSTRSDERNVFNAKYPSPLRARAGINRNLLVALGGTVLLLAAGAAYVWYQVVAENTPAPRPIAPQNKLVPLVVAPPVVTPPTVAPPVATPQAALPSPTKSAQVARVSRPKAKPILPKPAALSSSDNNALLIEQQTESMDPLLNDAYHAYRSGKFEQAQQFYRQALRLDARNADALLGLAVIAQHRGSDNEAAHYYQQVLRLDPRNAVANAGMSALTTDDNRVSRLKNLLGEQPDSPSLHFALGNRYAEQARWAEAQLAYFNAYRLEPHNAELAFNLAVSMDRLGQKSSAAQHYQQALQLDQSHSAGFDHAQIEQRVQELTR